MRSRLIRIVCPGAVSILCEPTHNGGQHALMSASGLETGFTDLSVGWPERFPA